MKAVILSVAALSLLLGDAVTPSAKAAGWSVDLEFNFPGRPGPGPNRPGFPPRDPGYGRDEVLHHSVNQEFRRDGLISLNHALRLGREHHGRTIKQVMLRASSQGYRRGSSEAVLLVNGRAVGPSQRIDRRSQEVVFTLPGYADEFGREIQQLQIELRGSTYVESVAAVLERERDYRPGPGPGFPQQEVIQINREFRQGHRILVGSLVNLERYRGMQLRSVSIRASNQMGFGEATFCGQSCTSIRQFGRGLNNYEFPIHREFVDHNARNWSIDLRGNFYVESIRLEFTR